MKKINTLEQFTIAGVTFQFTQVYSFSCSKFFITAFNGSSELVMFEMKKDANGRWQIIDAVPAWAARLEPHLVERLQLVQDNVYPLQPYFSRQVS
ncbi:MAG TPA: hypothetical protein VNS32_11565 [Flavisolibacter sp.]|nr:hypothetical protein [Flavisolibacter sp.]HWJ89988.1 hypothetical protein [Flavisolibacter sp.]